MFSLNCQLKHERLTQRFCNEGILRSVLRDYSHITNKTNCVPLLGHRYVGRANQGRRMLIVSQPPEVGAGLGLHVRHRSHGRGTKCSDVV